MSEWPMVEVRELVVKEERSAIAMGPFGSKIKASDYVGAGVPFLRGLNLAQGMFVDEDFIYITEDKAREVPNAAVRSGDLVFTCKGSIGQVSVIPRTSRFERYIISSNQMKASMDASRALPEFYYYWFRSSFGQRALLANASTVGVPKIANPIATLRAMKVPIPPLTKQQSIADLLGALDDKIAVNDHIASTARQLNCAIYASAVCDSSDEKRVEDIAGFLNRGQAPKYTDGEDSIVVVNQKCVRDGRINLEPARRTQANRVKADRILCKDDMLVNSTGVGTLGRVGIWSHDVVATVDSHVTIVRICRPLPAIVGAFAILAVEQLIESLGEGSTGQTELSRAKLASVVVRVPSDGLDDLAARLSAVEARADAALNESGLLAKLRDTLLPELMSGRLRIKDAEKVVEKAV